jgi:CRISPR-associated protein Cas2
MDRYMRIIVFFDLPVVKESDRKRYNKFRKYLLKNGYEMLQFSVYARICNGIDSMKVYLDKLYENTPDKGAVRVMTVTDKQYAEMKIFIGEKTQREKSLNNQQVLIF